MSNVLHISGLNKSYNGRKVVDNISLDVDKGDIVGLIGPNGAGKSTTMKMIMKLISKDSGEIELGEGKNIVEKVGFATESSAFYEYLSGFDNLMLIAKLYDDVSEDKVRDIIKFVGLSDHIDKKVKTYSTGMRQRLGLARALLNNPELLILDEPTNGLDPYGMKDIYEILEKLAREDEVAILISSHLLHDIEKICNKVVMINEGKLLFSGDIKDLGEGLEDSYYSMYRR
ncbi:MAG: ABC transporter ATP-binding protein [Butyrivibrio sp.]|jgi:ABC-2 type transport system ATP-binding protein|nr:ABC transporter ATP-binding protein [Butyrivibrio sp.]MBR4639647.1 ABC transporter ATP-binding protein [Butyrivibrio sp.]